MKGIVKGIVGILCMLYLEPGIAHPPSDAEKAACSKVKAQIRKVESRKRAGYTRAQGERLRARLRELTEKRRRVCR